MRRRGLVKKKKKKTKNEEEEGFLPVGEFGDDGDGHGHRSDRDDDRIIHNESYWEEEEEEGREIQLLKTEKNEKQTLKKSETATIKSTRDPTRRKEDAYDKLFANGAFDKKKLLRFFRRRRSRVAEDDEDNNRV